jgi:hypothetical protein
VDIYLGAIPPDGTFVSFKEMSPGVISATADSSPVPFLANVPLTQEFVPFSYTFTGAEPVGAYLMYAALVIPGRNPLFPENQLDVAVKSFQFSSDVCLSVSVGTGGWDTISPPGTYRGPTCPRAFAPGTTVTVTVQSIYQWPIRDDFLGWGGDCAEVGTRDNDRHGSCTLVMTTSKSVSASFYCPACLLFY